MRPAALIYGITGQDGSYLAEELLRHGYEVHGVLRRSSSINTARIDTLLLSGQVKATYGDVTDPLSVVETVRNVEPDQIYNLAAQSHVKVSFEIPSVTLNASASGTLNILEAIRLSGRGICFSQASSSEMFGNAPECPQNENTPFAPVSPYGVAKLASHHLTRVYREAYGIFAVSGILYNHESERRGETFVTRKITRAIGRIKVGLQSTVTLGNLDAKRDWGYAPEYVVAMHLMLLQSRPKDYVIGTGLSHSVREFAASAFEYAGLDMSRHLVVDAARYGRATEIHNLLADATLAKEDLGWAPRVGFKALVKRMVDHDVDLARHESKIDL